MTAKASPSMGEYRGSAGWVKRLPTRVTFQPDGQQSGLVQGHLQCFWRSQKLMPDFDQSVAMQVVSSLLNI